jgi:hypothetical protein
MDPRSRAPCPAPPAAPRRVGYPTSAAPLAGTPRPGSLSSCQARRCRRRVRTTTTGRTRTPSIGSTCTLRSRQARPRSLFTRVASPRTRSLAASLVPPRQGRVGRFELPRAPAAASPSPARGPRSLRGRCVSPTSATDSRHEHPAVRSIPGCALIRAAPCGATRLRTPTHPGREPRRPSSGACRSAYRMSHQVELRLTANLQLRPCRNHHVSPGGHPPGAEAPDVHVCGPARSWRSPDRRLLRAAPPAGGFLDRTPGWRHDL